MASRPLYGKLASHLQALEMDLASVKPCSSTSIPGYNFLKDILNNANTPIFLKRADYTYFFMNSEFERLAQVTLEKALGKDDFAIFPRSVAEFSRSQDEEVVNHRSVVEYEETVTLPDGDHTFIIGKFPLFDNQGNVAAVGGICTEITARKRVEDELREAEEKYRSIFENSPLGILQIDKDATIIACNEKLAEILGSSSKQIIGLNIFKSIHDEKVKEAADLALSGQISYQEGLYHSITSNEKVYLRGVFSPNFSNHGSISAAIGIIEDITERKKEEEAILKAQYELEQRVADRTAELNQKTKRLSEINTALEVLLEKREDDKQKLEEKIISNVENLIYPYLNKLEVTKSDTSKNALVKIIRKNFGQITSSFEHNNKSYSSKLTPTQLQVAELIKHGNTTKEIAHFLNLSPLTVSCHRQEIRRRLSLTNTKTNLQTVLSSNS